MKGHADWVAAGSPDSGLVLPLKQLRDVCRDNGFTVYDFPNEQHLLHVPPEDHTYYSQTNFPGGQEVWWRHAIDIMPGPGGGEGLRRLGQRLVDERNAGRITWLKYINWPSTGRLDQAVKDSWQPGHVRTNSSDVGHIHASAKTGVATVSSPFNPFAAGGASMTRTLNNDDLLAIGDMVAQWATVEGTLPGSADHIGSKVNLNVINKKVEDAAAAVMDIKAAVLDIKTRVTSSTGLSLTTAQLADLATQVSSFLVASNANGLTTADHEALVADVKVALETARITTQP